MPIDHGEKNRGGDNGLPGGGFTSNSHNKPFARLYRDLVGDPDKRWGKEGPFLTGLIDEVHAGKGGGDSKVLVLETAGGLGIEAAKIHETRGAITRLLVNEHDRHLRKRLRRILKRRKVPLVEDKVTPHSWGEMVANLSEYRGQCDVVLCVGNSLPYLGTDNERSSALDSFGELMSPEGVLVLDNRNYDAIIAWAAGILSQGRSLSDAGAEFPFSGAPMFNGSVRGRPVHASIDRSITFKYEEEGPREGQEPRPEAHITYTPMGHLRMLGLLRTRGFDVDFFYDFRPEADSGEDHRRGAGFIQYVCRRRG